MVSDPKLVPLRLGYGLGGTTLHNTRRTRWLGVLAAAGLAGLAANAQTPPPDPAPPAAPDAVPLSGRDGLLPGPPRADRRYGMTAGWLDGLKFQSADDAFHVHVGGNA